MGTTAKARKTEEKAGDFYKRNIHFHRPFDTIKKDHTHSVT